MVTITLYARQQKRHWCIEQSFGLCGRGRGWDDLGEWHWNMYNIIYETSRQSRFDARYWMLGLVHWDDPEGWYGEGGGFRMGNTCILIKCKKKKKQTLTLFQSSWRWSFSHVCSYNKFYKIDIYFNYNPEYPRSINMLCVQVFLAFVGTQNILSLYFFTG